MHLTYTILYVENVALSCSFYEKCFGIKIKFIHEAGDYGEMDTGSTTLAFTDHKLAGKILSQDHTKSSLKTPPIGSQITFTPENVKESFKLAVDNGATIISAPEIKPWNFEVAMLRDCDGHIVELAKNLNP